MTTPVGSAAEPVLDDLLCFDLYATSRAMTARYRPLLEEAGLTYPQYLVLVVLWRRGTCTVGDVAAALQLDHGTLTPLLRRMAERGLLVRERADGDRRVVTLALGPAGEELRPLQEQVSCALRACLGLDDDEIVALQRTLRALAARLEADAAR